MSVDLWCLGVLTYELLTGKAPFYHLSRKETMKKILNVETESITYPETMSPQAMDFIEKLIRKDPNERMKAADALKHPYLKSA
jgi:aurora kinase, other